MELTGSSARTSPPQSHEARPRLYFRAEYVVDVRESGMRETFDVFRPRRIRDGLVECGAAAAEEFIVPAALGDADLLLVHTPEHVERILCGNGIVEAGELCDQGYNGGACCTASCQFRSNGTACNDANGCTQADQCQAGVCVGSPVRCAASDACHVAGTCNPTTGLCANPAAANGLPCDDRNACTQTDACQSGMCRGANTVTCPGTDQCQQASCNPATGTCSSQAKADGTECIDGDACTLGDRCLGGACVSGAARDCDDHLSCTDDECVVATGCGHTETPTCDGCDAAECAACGAACETANAQCADHCWSAFFSCLNGCTTTYCAPFCQADLSQCVTNCPSVAICRDGCDAGNGCATGCSEAQ